MKLKTRVNAQQMIGKAFVEKLETEVVLKIGDTEFARQGMIDSLGCANFNAAARISRTLKRLRVHSIPELFRMDPATLYRIRGVGDTQVYVIMCVLDHFGYSVKEWWGWSEESNRVTFSTHKHRIKVRATRRKDDAA
jgi:hypothetical protein